MGVPGPKAGSDWIITLAGEHLGPWFAVLAFVVLFFGPIYVAIRTYRRKREDR